MIPTKPSFEQIFMSIVESTTLKENILRGVLMSFVDILFESDWLVCN